MVEPLRNFGAAMAVAVVAMLAVPAMAETAPPAAASKIITLRADPSCPSNCEPGSDHPGYDIELAEKIFGKAGYQVDYKLLSWTRTVVEVRNGAFDGFVAGIKDDAPDFVFPEEPSGVLLNGFAWRKGTGWSWKGVASLEGKVLGTIPDYQYFPELKTYIDAHANDPKRIQGMAMMNATELNIKKMAVGRIDVTCDDLSVLRYNVKQLKLGDKVEVGSPVGDPIPNYIAFGPNNPRAAELARLWDEGIRRMRANGELKAVLDRYGVTDWK